MNWTSITYKGITYECRIVPDYDSINEDGSFFELLVAPIALQDRIQEDNDEEAKNIDECICYYARPMELALSDKELYRSAYG